LLCTYILLRVMYAAYAFMTDEVKGFDFDGANERLTIAHSKEEREEEESPEGVH